MPQYKALLQQFGRLRMTLNFSIDLQNLILAFQIDQSIDQNLNNLQSCCDILNSKDSIKHKEVKLHAIYLVESLFSYFKSQSSYYFKLEYQFLVGDLKFLIKLLHHLYSPLSQDIYFKLVNPKHIAFFSFCHILLILLSKSSIFIFGYFKSYFFISDLYLELFEPKYNYM